MEECEKRVLCQFWTRLVNEIVVTGSFLSAFCEQSVLDEEMTKIVKSEDNYAAKAHKLLELLPKRGPKAFSTLMEILAITNPWLAEKMKSALHEERKREAKLKIGSTTSNASSIQGYGSSSLRNVDNDLKAMVHQFVKNNLQNLTESEQRTTEKWLGEEMQRERRRQQFRQPHNFRRHPEEFQSCKEVQTEMTGMDLQELNEDIMIQLHGVDYVDKSSDLSFKMLHKLVSELLQRVQGMDLLFVQCLEKFGDTDRYSLSLPDMIGRYVHRQKELHRALADSQREIQKLTEERDALDRNVRRLEVEVAHMLKRQSHAVVHPHQMYLKKRKELQARYTMITKHADKPKKQAGTTATGAGGATSGGGEGSGIGGRAGSVGGIAGAGGGRGGGWCVRGGGGGGLGTGVGGEGTAGGAWGGRGGAGGAGTSSGGEGTARGARRGGGSSGAGVGGERTTDGGGGRGEGGSLTSGERTAGSGGGGRREEIGGGKGGGEGTTSCGGGGTGGVGGNCGVEGGGGGRSGEGGAGINGDLGGGDVTQLHETSASVPGPSSDQEEELVVTPPKPKVRFLTPTGSRLGTSATTGNARRRVGSSSASKSVLRNSHK